MSAEHYGAVSAVPHSGDGGPVGRPNGGSAAAAIVEDIAVAGGSSCWTARKVSALVVRLADSRGCVLAPRAALHASYSPR